MICYGPRIVLLVTVLGGLMAGIIGLVLLTAPLTAIGLNFYRELKGSWFFD